MDAQANIRDMSFTVPAPDGGKGLGAEHCSAFQKVLAFTRGDADNIDDDLLQSVMSRLEEAPEIIAQLRELSAAAMRVMAASSDKNICGKFIAEAEAAGVKDGIGVRAQNWLGDMRNTKPRDGATETRPETNTKRAVL